MASLTLRQSKGSPLTFEEVDGNFTALNSELAEKIPAARAITAGVGIAGGGDLSANRVISLNADSIASLVLADTAVQPARTVTAGTGLTGGGDLSQDRTLAADFAAEADIQAGADETKILNSLRARQMLDQRPPGVPISSKSANYTVTATDKGYCISISSGALTLPSGLAAGTAITIYNNSSSARSVVQGSGLTLRLGGTTITGSRTLINYGLATVLYVSTSVAVISGSGLS